MSNKSILDKWLRSFICPVCDSRIEADEDLYQETKEKHIKACEKLIREQIGDCQNFD